MKRKPYKVADGDHQWLRLDYRERDYLVERKLIHLCDGDCGGSVYHPMVSIAACENALAERKERMAKTTGPTEEQNFTIVVQVTASSQGAAFAWVETALSQYADQHEDLMPERVHLSTPDGLRSVLL